MYRRRRGISLVFLIYLIIGIFVAFDYGYITGRLLRSIASAILAVLLWWLVLLGVDFRL